MMLFLKPLAWMSVKSNKKSFFGVMLFFTCMVFITSGEVCLYAASDAYDVEFKGVEDKELLSRIRDLSVTVKKAEKPLVSINGLNKSMSEDVKLFMKLLKSEGYFDAEIIEKIDTNKKKWEAIFLFKTNTPFILSSVNVSFSDKTQKDIKLPDISKTGIGLNKSYSSRSVLDGQEKLLYFIRKQGFPHPELENREIVADHSTREVTVKFIFKANAKAVFGKTEFKGLKKIDEPFLEKYIPWKTGDDYDPDLLEKCYSDLMKLGLFSTIKISEGKNSDKSIFPVEIEVNERKGRTVGIGINYHTDEGPGS